MDQACNSYELVPSLIPANGRVLDVGCGFGAIAKALQEQGCSVIGVEPDEKRRAVSGAFCEAIFDGVAEGLGNLDLEPGSFDAVIFADVLEHLADPWTALRDSLAYLSPDGQVVISIPNFANFGVRWNLLKGEFRYQDFGVYDRTHLRFFTRTTLVDLVESVGLEVVAWRYSTNLSEIGLIKRTIGRLPPAYRAFRRFDRWLTYRWNTMLAVQFVISCRRRPVPAS